MLSAKLVSSLFNAGVPTTSKKKDETNKILSTTFYSFGAAYGCLGEQKTAKCVVFANNLTDGTDQSRRNKVRSSSRLEEGEGKVRMNSPRSKCRDGESISGRSSLTKGIRPEAPLAKAIHDRYEDNIDESGNPSIIRKSEDTCGLITMASTDSAFYTFSCDELSTCDVSLASTSTFGTDVGHSSVFSASSYGDKSTETASTTGLSTDDTERISKLSSSIVSSVKHIQTRSRIKSRREKARMKYQSILLKRTSISSGSSTTGVSNISALSEEPSISEMQTEHHSILDGSVSSISKKSSKNFKPKKLLRQCSEIDDREDRNMFFLEADEFTSSTGIPGVFGTSWLSLDNLGMKRHSSSVSMTKKKPYIRKYAEEYNMLVSAVSKTFVNRDSKHEHGRINVSDQNGTVIKFGVLKKMTHMDIGIGMDVFVELRPGMVTCYEEMDGTQNSLDVKSIPIRKATCTCQPTKSLRIAPFPGWDSIFEVAFKDGGTQYWMAESEEGRKDWIEAFMVAMDADSDLSDIDDDGTVQSTQASCSLKSKAGRNADILLYLHVRGLIQASSSKDEYMDALSMLVDKSMCVPIDWLRQYFDDVNSFKRGRDDSPAHWERMSEDRISVNGHIGKGGIESIIVSLKSHIQDLDRCSNFNEDAGSYGIKESQAVFYARDILLYCDRADIEEESLYCTSKLFHNSELSSMTLGSAELEPIKISLRTLSKDDEIVSANTLVDILDKRHDFTVEVTIRATSIYRIRSATLPTSEDTWALIRTNCIQKLVLSPNEMKEAGQFVQFDIMPF